MKRSLILNKHWTPIRVCSVEKAVVYMFRDAARAMDTETYELYDLENWLERSALFGDELPREKVIQTTSIRLEKPEIIVLDLYGGIPRIEATLNRKNLIKRDNSTCQYCNRQFSKPDLSIDHVIPKSRGGKHTWENAVLACMKCNSKKSDKLIREAGLKLIRRPRRPGWSPVVSDFPKNYPPSWKKFVNDR